MEIEKRQVAKLKDLKNSRDKAKVDRALAQLQSATEKGENLMPHIISAVKSFGSLWRDKRDTARCLWQIRTKGFLLDMEMIYRA